MLNIGVFAIQGAVAEHVAMLNQIEGVTGVPVKTIEEINAVDGLILPGGESTAMGKIMDYFNLLEPLKEKIQQGFPVWGTCAGMILLAKTIVGQEHTYFAAMDTVVKRNAYGSQLDSFQMTLSLPAIAATPISLIFIRAPYIETVGANVEILAEADGKIVAAKQANMLATSFHPELTKDLSFHKYFCHEIVAKPIATNRL